MNDLAQLFERDLARIPSPPMWADIERRAAAPEPALAPVAPLPSPEPRRRLAAVLVAAVLTVALVVGLVAIRQDEEAPPLTDQTPSLTTVSPQEAVLAGLDGVIQQRFGRIPRDAYALALSPDHSALAYTRSLTPDTSQLYVRTRGGGTRALLSAGLSGAMPTWSPDGTMLAFEGHRPDGDEDIYVIPAAGGKPRRLTSSPFDEVTPAWIPDGTTVLYVNAGSHGASAAGTSPTSTIWEAPIDGAPASRLPGIPKGASAPDYDPQGGRIAFAHGGIWAIGVDGSRLMRLSTAGLRPRWSPDGTTIAFLAPTGTTVTVEAFARRLRVPAYAVRLLTVSSGATRPFEGIRVAGQWNAPRWTADGTGLFVYRLREA